MKHLFLFLTVSLLLVYFVPNTFADKNDSFDENLEFPTVYQIPYAIFDKEVYTWGDQVNITVISPLHNIDPTHYDTLQTGEKRFQFTIMAFPSQNTLSNYSLVESGPDTGVFTGSFEIVKPDSQIATALGDDFLEVDENTTTISASFTDYNTTASNSLHFTYPEDKDPPREYLFNQTHSVYPNAQFRWIEPGGPYNGTGMVIVQYPSQNTSTKIIDTIYAGLSSYGKESANVVYLVLTETGQDTGIFSGILPISTYPSFTQLSLFQHENNLRSFTIQYIIDNHLSHGSDSNRILLHNSLEYPVNNQNQKLNPNLQFWTDQKSYLPSQPILISGIAEPADTLNLVISSQHGSAVNFQQIQVNDDGNFETEFVWTRSDAPSGTYFVRATSMKHDYQISETITIVTPEDLHSRTILVPPKQQFAMGFSSDEIVCKQVWKSVLKPGGEFPACVKLPTYTKLLERGWIPAR